MPIFLLFSGFLPVPRRFFLFSDDDANINVLHYIHSRIPFIRDEGQIAHEHPRQTQMPLLEDISKPVRREAGMTQAETLGHLNPRVVE